MTIENKKAVPLFDDSTKFLEAKYLVDGITNTVGKTLVKCCAAIHTVLENLILVGQGSKFLAIICTDGPCASS